MSKKSKFTAIPIATKIIICLPSIWLRGIRTYDLSGHGSPPMTMPPAHDPASFHLYENSSMGKSKCKKTVFFLKKLAFSAAFSLFNFSVQLNTAASKIIYRPQDSARGSLVLELTAIPTEPQPLPCELLYFLVMFICVDDR